MEERVGKGTDEGERQREGARMGERVSEKGKEKVRREEKNVDPRKGDKREKKEGTRVDADIATCVSYYSLIAWSSPVPEVLCLYLQEILSAYRLACFQSGHFFSLLFEPIVWHVLKVVIFLSSLFGFY